MLARMSPLHTISPRLKICKCALIGLKSVECYRHYTVLSVTVFGAEKFVDLSNLCLSRSVMMQSNIKHKVFEPSYTPDNDKQ